MTAANYNITIEQGSTFSLTITWQDPQGQAIDLTGYKVRMQVRATFDDLAPLVSFDSSALADGQSIGALDATGIISVVLADEITAALDFNAGVYDLLAESPAGEVHRIVQGRVEFERAVTR